MLCICAPALRLLHCSSLACASLSPQRKSTTSDGRTIYGEPKPRLITEPRFMLRALDASEVDVSAVREKDELKLQPDAQAFIDKDDTIAMASTLWRSL